MKRIVLLLAVFALGLSAASFAVAKPPPGKGKDKTAPTSTTVSDPANCHPQVSVILKGDFVSGGGGSFTMDVKQSNFHGRDLVGKPLTLKFADFKAGDRLNVQARACKAKKNAPTAPNAAPPALLAKRVTGHPAKNDSDSESEAGTTTTTP